MLDNARTTIPVDIGGVRPSPSAKEITLRIRRGIIASLMATLAIAPLAATPASASSGLSTDATASATVAYLIAQHSGKGAAVAGASTANGAAVVQWDLAIFNGIDNEIWRFIPLTGTNRYAIMNEHSLKYLVVQGASTSLNAAVIQWTYSADAYENDVWIRVSTSFGMQWMNSHSRLCLTVQNASTVNGARLLQHSCADNGRHNNVWRFV